MDRRRFLAVAGAGLLATLAGCAGDGPDPTPTPTPTPTPAPTPTPGDPWEPHAPSGAGVPGRIDPIGHTLGDVFPLYTAGAVSPDGTWGVLGSHTFAHVDVASTLVDLDDLAAPRVVHHLPAANGQTRSNDVTFDATRDGLYYRAQEANDLHREEPVGERGVEVVDFGWGSGTPGEPAVVASVETLPVGTHRLTTHPDEPLLYLVDVSPETDVGVRTVDVTDPTAPAVVHEAGPPGGCHDVAYDPVRAALHAAYIDGANEGYVTYDAADPWAPEPIGGFAYDGQPGYAALGVPGFEACHQAAPDPGRDLAVIGDELVTGIPGGKHVFDIGWDEGTLTEPVPIGFTHAPDARAMPASDPFAWTTHLHDVVPMGGETLVVDGGYRQGVWVCNITDPREPIPTERYATVSGADAVPAPPWPATFPALPFAWSAVYHGGRDFVFAVDSVTGAYTLGLTAEAARGDRGRGPDGHYDIDAVLDGITVGGDT